MRTRSQVERRRQLLAQQCISLVDAWCAEDGVITTPSPPSPRAATAAAANAVLPNPSDMNDLSLALAEAASWTGANQTAPALAVASHWRGLLARFERIVTRIADGNTRTAAAADNDDDLCITCLSNQANVVFHPCGHECMCGQCVAELIVRGLPCPLCRSPILC